MNSTDIRRGISHYRALALDAGFLSFEIIFIAVMIGMSYESFWYGAGAYLLIIELLCIRWIARFVIYGMTAWWTYFAAYLVWGENGSVVETAVAGAVVAFIMYHKHRRGCQGINDTGV